MGMNCANLQGTLPKSEKLAPRMYNENKPDNAVLQFKVSVRRKYKKNKEDQFYPEDLLDCKAFGQTAFFIRDHFGPGDPILLSARVQRNDDYEKDGVKQYGEMYIHVEEASFVDGQKAPAPAKAEAQKTAAAPTAPAAAPARPASSPLGRATPLGARKTG